ncbi:MAG: hypothetical protein OEW45_07260 [Deltaproteobacteria bacterium]|nr:hypothetical protein [Deltaproteobacteria bacterium]
MDKSVTLLTLYNKAGEVDRSVYGDGKYKLAAFPSLYRVEQGAFPLVSLGERIWSIRGALPRDRL